MTASSSSLVDAYLTHLTVERRLAANSVESYARDLVLLAEFSAGRGRPLAVLTREDLEGLVRDLMAEGRSPRSVARAVACFRGFYRFLVVDGTSKTSPAADLRPPRAWKTLPRYLVDRGDRPAAGTTRYCDAAGSSRSRADRTALRDGHARFRVDRSSPSGREPGSFVPDVYRKGRQAADRAHR